MFVDDTREVVYESCSTVIEYKRQDIGFPIALPQSPDVTAIHTFVFYCHGMPSVSPIHLANYTYFLNDVLPMLENRLGMMVCLILNETEPGPDNVSLRSKWIAPNVFRFHRPNIGFDFGGFGDAAYFFQLPQKQAPYHLICLNDTIFGPVFPAWLDPKPDWTQILKNLITEETKVGGMTINTHTGRPHVQSMLFVTDKIGFDLAWAAHVFDIRTDKHLLIQGAEIELSKCVLAKGYNINCLAAKLRGIDYRKPLRFDLGDVCIGGRYESQAEVQVSGLHPLDSLFCKTTRYGLQTCHMLVAASKQKK